MYRRVLVTTITADGNFCVNEEETCANNDSPECRHASYNGKKAATKSGKPCKNWKVTTDWAKEYMGDHNYCRNPDGEPGPWCYTTEGGTEWEFCFGGTAGTCKNIDNCAGKDCSGHGNCVDGVNSYTCKCNPGYEGTDCQKNINDCAGKDCNGHGTCVDGVNSYTCRCTDGYRGNDCQILPSLQPWCKDKLGKYYAGQYLASNGHCYWRFGDNNGRTWDEALELCQQMIAGIGTSVQKPGFPAFGRLAHITSSEIEQLVLPFSTFQSFWIGGRYQSGQRTVLKSYSWMNDRTTPVSPITYVLSGKRYYKGGVSYLRERPDYDCMTSLGRVFFNSKCEARNHPVCEFIPGSP